METEALTLRVKNGRRFEYRRIVVPTTAEQLRIALALHEHRVKARTEVLGWTVWYLPPSPFRIGVGEPVDPFKTAQEQPPPVMKWSDHDTPAECYFGYHQEWSVVVFWRNGPDEPPVVIPRRGEIVRPGVVAVQESLLGWTGRGSRSDDTRAEEEDQILLEGRRRALEGDEAERNPQARRRCLAYYGVRCFICDFDFGDFYGHALAAGFIHVHHLSPLSSSEGPRAVDPVRDLRPLCPNCHSFVHMVDPPREVDEARALISERRNARPPRP